MCRLPAPPSRPYRVRVDASAVLVVTAVRPVADRLAHHRAPRRNYGSARCQSRAWVAAWKSRSRRWPSSWQLMTTIPGRRIPEQSLRRWQWVRAPTIFVTQDPSVVSQIDQSQVDYVAKSATARIACCASDDFRHFLKNSPLPFILPPAQVVGAHTIY